MSGAYWLVRYGVGFSDAGCIFREILHGCLTDVACTDHSFFTFFLMRPDLSHLVEPLAVAATVLSVWGASREATWSWAIGLVGTVAYAVLCARFHLWGSLALQGVFAVQGIHGLWIWSRRRNTGVVSLQKADLRFGSDSPPTTSSDQSAQSVADGPTAGLSSVDLMIGCIVFGLYVALLWSAPRVLTQNAPWWRLDWAVAGLSIWSTWLLAYKRTLSWAGWFATNISSVVLWQMSGAHLSSLLYAGLAVFALITWRSWSQKSSALAGLERVP